MRRRRSSDPIGDTASNLGNAMDELMRNQPSLKADATKAIIRLLKELVQLGTDPKYICWRAQNKNDTTPTNASGSGNTRQPNNTQREDMAAGSSDDEDEDEEEASTSSHNNPHREENQAAGSSSGGQENASSSAERIPIALIDYILNVMKFVEAILSNNSTDDHCREFVEQSGLEPLLQILALPNLPVTSCNTPITATAQAVASVCKSILVSFFWTILEVFFFEILKFEKQNFEKLQVRKIKSSKSKSSKKLEIFIFLKLFLHYKWYLPLCAFEN